MTDATGEGDGDLWVFGYGSLIWDPCFAPVERVLAEIEGYRRSFCMWSIQYRGTPERPGLVLALDMEAGAVCRGVGFRVPVAERAGALRELRARELVSYAYREAWVPMRLEDGREVTAVTYLADPGHAQYTGPLGAEEQARIITAASGNRGPNRDYLVNTVRHLAELGITDPGLDALLTRVDPASV